MFGKPYVDINSIDFNQFPKDYLFKAIFSEKARAGGILILTGSVVIFSGALLALILYLAIRSYVASLGIEMGFSSAESEFVLLNTFYVITGAFGIFGGIQGVLRKKFWHSILGGILLTIALLVSSFYSLTHTTDEAISFIPFFYNLTFLIIFGFIGLIMLFISREEFNIMLLIKSKVFPSYTPISSTYPMMPYPIPEPTSKPRTEVSHSNIADDDAEMIKCPVCKELFLLREKARPIEIKCPHCGAEGELD